MRLMQHVIYINGIFLQNTFLLSDNKRPCLSAGGEPESEIWDLLAGSAEAEKVPQAVSPRWSGHG